MSSRNQSLYRRLDELLPQLDKLLIENLQQEVAGKRSMFISRLIDHFYDGRSYQRPEVELAEEIASEVITLKDKLGEPLFEGATGIILAYTELKENRKSLYGEERTNFAKVQLAKLGVKSIENTPSESKTIGRLKTNDRISKPSKGRYFPTSTSELVSIMNKLSFNHSKYSQRIDLSFINPDVDGDYGIKVAAFYPSDELIIFSFTEDFPQVRAKILINTSLHEFSCIDKEVTGTWNRQKSISYRAYLSEQNQLILTRRERSAKAAKYRSTDKFSSRCSPKGIRTDEVVLKRIEIS